MRTDDGNNTPRQQTACLLLGLAFLWLCLKSAALAITQQLDTAQLGDALAAGAWYLVYAAAVALSCWAIVRARSTEQFRRHRRALAVACAIAGGLGMALVHSSAGGWLPLSVGLVLCAVFIANFLSAWGAVVVEQPIARIPFAIATSYVVSELVRAGVTFFGLEMLRPAFPLLSLVFFLLLPAPALAPRVSERKSLTSLSWKIIATSVVLIVLWSVVTGAASAGTTGSLPDADRVWAYLVSCVVLGAMAAYFFVQGRRGQTGRHVFLSLFAALIVAYMVLLAAMLVFPQADGNLAKRTLIAVEQCLEVFVLIFILHNVAERNLSPIAILGIYATVLTSGPWMILADIVKAAGVLSAIPRSDVALIALSLVTAIVFIVFLLGYAVSDDAVGGTETAADAGALLCEKVAAGAGLSARELEVMRLLYRGYSGKRIAEELYISDSTVRSHTNSIYKKLAIHSKQELIALIEGYRD